MEEVIIKVQTTVKSEGGQTVGQVKEDIAQAKTEATGLSSALDKATNGMVTGFKNGVQGIKAAVLGMKSFRAAIVATGIGALLVAITSLVAYFQKTERGAQQLRVIMATLGAVIDVLIDSVIALGEGLFNAFTNPKKALDDLGKAFAYYFTEFIPNAVRKVIDGLGLLGESIALLFEGEFTKAAETAAEGLASIGDGVTDLIPATAILKSVVNEVIELGKAANDAATQAAALERALNRVLLRERELIVERAKANAQRAELLLLVQDENASLEDRIANLTKANAIESEITAKEIANEKERLRILKAKANLAESDEATLRAIAEQEAKVIDLQTASFMKAREVAGQIKGLRAQAAAEELANLKAIADAEKARQDAALEAAQKQADAVAAIEQATLSAYDREWQAAYDHYANLIALAEQYGMDTVQLREQQAKAVADVEKKFADEAAAKQTATDEAVAAAKANMIEGGFKLAQSLAEQGSDTAKGIAVAETIWNTSKAIMGMLSAQPAGPWNFVQAGVAAAMGAANIANILKTDPSSSSGGGSVPAVSVPSAGATSTANTLQGSNVNQIANIISEQNRAPQRAYVVSGDVTTQQALDRRIRENATF